MTYGLDALDDLIVPVSYYEPPDVTVECSRCLETGPEAGVEYDDEGEPLCPPCFVEWVDTLPEHR